MFRMKDKKDYFDLIDSLGDNHAGGSIETPMRADAHMLSDEEKIKIIQTHFSKVLEALGLDLTDDSLKGTSLRVAKMFVKEIFSGLNPMNEPIASVFENKYGYNRMLVEKNIALYSTCEHHFLPIVGKAHVAYFPKNNVIGLSKLNRIVEYYAKRPQVQERLNVQIVNHLKKVLETDDVACLIDAKHLCVNSRGIKDVTSSTLTFEYSGKFQDPQLRKEFFETIKLDPYPED